MSSAKTFRERIEDLSARVGSDPLLIQGAGGNISWKEDGTLWVKSSGAWLAHACREDMFVPIDLFGVRGLIGEGRENYGDFRIGASALRPSIETALHALMPQRVVAHLHAVDAIAHAVRIDGERRLEELLHGIEWMWLPYHKPGAALASAVAAGLNRRIRAPDVLVLANHGIVFCGEDTLEVERLTEEVIARLRIPARDVSEDGATLSMRDGVELEGYRRLPTARSLAFDPISHALARSRWVIYPDHAVFLGPAARVFDSAQEALDALGGEVRETAVPCPCVIVKDVGVWLPIDASPAAIDMLDCYVAVCLRLPTPDVVRVLDEADVFALLNWEAERYRKNLSQ